MMFRGLGISTSHIYSDKATQAQPPKPCSKQVGTVAKETGTLVGLFSHGLFHIYWLEEWVERGQTLEPESPALLVSKPASVDQRD
jgi:hypothetical protein